MSHLRFWTLVPCALLLAGHALAQPAASASSAAPAPPAAPASSAPAPAANAEPAGSQVPAVPTPASVPEPVDAGAPDPDASTDATAEAANEPLADAGVDDVVEAPVEAAVKASAEDDAASPVSSAEAADPPPASSSPASEPRPDAIAGQEPPLWNLLPLLPERGKDDAGLAEQLLPDLGLGNRGNLFGFAVLLALSALIANVSGRIRRRLPVRGLLPRAVAGLHVGMRALVAVFFVVLLANWITGAYVPVVLWVALAAAAAAGWSARDFLPDLFAGVVLLIERRVRPGTWVTGNGFAGEIETLGPRATRLRDVDGRVVAVPNRKLLGGPVAIDTSRQPSIEVVVRVPAGTQAAAARQAIEDAALLSPWRVLRDRPEVRHDANDPQTWTVRTRLIEPRFARAFESALVDHVEELLER